MTQKSRGQIGPAIAVWRKTVGMTQQDLAHDLGVSVSFIGQMEIGKKNPSMEMVVQIVMLLNRKRSDIGLEPVDMNESLLMAGYPAVAAPQRFAELVQIVGRLTTNKMRTALALLRALGDDESEEAEEGDQSTPSRS